MRYTPDSCHTFESTTGYPEDCAVCCKKHGTEVLCAHCDKEIPRSWQYGDLLGFEDYRGNRFCDEHCEMLHRLDIRPFLLSMVTVFKDSGYEETAGIFAKQLTTFARALDEVKEAL